MKKKSVGMEKKELTARTDGTWLCYACNLQRDEVVSIPDTSKTYFCPECLWRFVQDGTLIVQQWDRVSTPEDERIPDSKPVVTDDGTIADEGVEFDFSGW